MSRYSSWCLRALVLGTFGLLGLWWSSTALPPTAVAATTLVVNSSDDTVDASAGDGNCADANDNCTLRAAIEETNALPVDRIEFNGNHLITVTCTVSALPAITSPGLTIDAQAHTITVAGGDDCENYSGLTIEADNASLKGLRIGPESSTSFLHAVDVASSSASEHIVVTKSTAPCVFGNSVDDIVIIGGANNTVRDCFIGVSATLENLDNGSSGIELVDGVGGDVLIKNNTIGFVFDGVHSDAHLSDDLRLTIANNYIGTDKSGTANIGDLSDALSLQLDEAGGDATVTISNNHLFNNGDDGVDIGGNGVYALTDNRIDHNGDNGVVVFVSGVTVKLVRNLFGFNGGLAIDLDDSGDEVVTCGDGDGSDPNTNLGIRCPKITAVTPAGKVSGTANCDPGDSCTVEVYIAQVEGNDLGHGEGLTLAGSTTFTGSGPTTAWSVNTGGLKKARFVTATLTNNDGKVTSEFAANFNATNTPALVDGIFLDAPGGDPLGGLHGFGGEDVRDIKTKGKGGVNVASGDGPAIPRPDTEEIPFRLENIGGRADRIKLSSINSSRSLKGVTITFDADGTANDLNKVNDGTAQLAGGGQIDGVLKVSVSNAAALGKYSVIVNFKANGSGSNDQGDSVNLKFRVVEAP